jgi:hypothetical protein
LFYGVGRHRLALGVLSAEIAGILVIAGSVRQPHGLSKVGLEPADERQLLARSRFLDLFRRRALGLDFLQNCVDGLFQVGQGIAGTWRHDDPELPYVLVRALKRLHGGGRLLVVHERFREACRARAGQDRSKDIQRESVLTALADGRPLDVEPGNLHAILVDEPPFGLKRDRQHRWARDRFAAGNVAEVLLHPRLRLGGIEIADDRQIGVVRRVVEPEKALDVLFACGRQIRHASNDWPGVGMLLGIRRFREDLEGASVRLIVHALAPFVLDDVTLGVQLGEIERVEQEAHSVGLYP